MNSQEKFEIVPLRKGGFSLRSMAHGETFHPVIGPMEEARILHVEQQKIVERAGEVEKFIIWDVGLGAAANAISALNALIPESSKVEIHSFDRTVDPLNFALENQDTLSYIAPHDSIVRRLIQEGEVVIRNNLKWIFHPGDFRQTMLKENLPKPHSIFYDPYSPSGNVEMWTLDHFKNLFSVLGTEVPFLLTNYTRSTAVRVSLLLAGFHVGTGILIGDKSETTIASNNSNLIKPPLCREWLAKVWISRNGAPIQSRYLPSNSSHFLISEPEMLNLEKHPQFSFTAPR